MICEGGRLFPYMTVAENLQLGAFSQKSSNVKDRMQEMFDLFPILFERQDQFAGHLSGGERQMCAIARAMMSHPKLLMLDEPSVGLSPKMVEFVFETLVRLVKKEALTILLVEQNVCEALEIADRAYVLDHGHQVRHGTANELIGDPQIQETYMGL
jgi:branched-chain amino acid transport system ATP-binding protein